eukprot:1229443-Rhodomonas_salina.1
MAVTAATAETESPSRVEGATAVPAPPSIFSAAIVKAAVVRVRGSSWKRGTVPQSMARSSIPTAHVSSFPM